VKPPSRLLFRLIGQAMAAYFAIRYGLPPATNKIRIQRDIVIKANDGVELLTDLYMPTSPGPHPTLLMRLPYGRDGFANIARSYSERGFNLVLQACRGTEASGGRFNPLVSERDDGLATLAWIRAQPWYDGRLGLTGPSYLGYAVWAIADAPDVKAMAVKVSSAEFRSVVFPSGAFHLGLWLSWVQTIEGLRGSKILAFLRMITGDVERRTHQAALTLPLTEADNVAVGHDVWFWNEWFDTAIEDGPFWDAIDHRRRLGQNPAPTHLLSGWYDFMIDQLLADYARLVAAGGRPYLTVSSTTHITGGHEADNPQETLAWMRAELLGDRSGIRARPVAIEVSGTNRWHEFDAFPPGPPRLERLFPQPDRSLGPTVAGPSAPSRYRYDPADPTPNLGGAIFAFTGAGPVWQKPLESRRDVLVFTGGPLAAPLTIIGNVTARVFIRASIPHADLFVRLSDVDAKGFSINICDGFIRLTATSPADAGGIWGAEIRLHATAHCFAAGHRLRLLVASGAHPRYARNTGTADPVGTATRLVAADIEIFHDADHPTSITLPVYELA